MCVCVCVNMNQIESTLVSVWIHKQCTRNKIVLLLKTFIGGLQKKHHHSKVKLGLVDHVDQQQFHLVIPQLLLINMGYLHLITTTLAANQQHQCYATRGSAAHAVPCPAESAQPLDLHRSSVASQRGGGQRPQRVLKSWGGSLVDKDWM